MHKHIHQVYIYQVALGLLKYYELDLLSNSFEGCIQILNRNFDFNPPMRGRQIHRKDRTTIKEAGGGERVGEDPGARGHPRTRGQQQGVVGVADAYTDRLPRQQKEEEGRCRKCTKDSYSNVWSPEDEEEDEDCVDVSELYHFDDLRFFRFVGGLIRAGRDAWHG
eukprot:GHVQ01033696.1.p1 GENE.GHVQ01033696.1~~GHVQ01033696.1.p1  ORF type:complete len:165 (+),score=22.66 GHVQ01033696.1:644-1138(+)